MHRHEANNIKQVALSPNDEEYTRLKDKFLKTFKPGGIAEKKITILEATCLQTTLICSEGTKVVFLH